MYIDTNSYIFDYVIFYRDYGFGVWSESCMYITLRKDLQPSKIL